jgi:hypothetical protein
VREVSGRDARAALVEPRALKQRHPDAHRHAADRLAARQLWV